MPLKKFAMIQFGILFLIAGLAIYPVFEFLPPGSLTFVWIAMSLSAVSGFIAYLIVSNGIEKSINLFTTYIIGSMLAKMMIGIASIFLVALRFETYSTVYVLTYFFCYFIFTSFEVYALMRKLRPISIKGKRNSHDTDASK